MSTDDAPKATILAVDDTPENLDVVKGILIPRYTVKATTSGATALKIAAHQPPDLILLDVMMPDMDGYEVCRRLKADPVTSDIPVVFLTAKDQAVDEAMGLELGACDYIPKPVSPPILAARVDTHLSLRRNVAALRDAYRIIKSQQERMQEELNVARDIQMSMVPVDFGGLSDPKTLSVHAWLEPAREVGGDFYDFFFLDEGRVCLCIGDVSGKGVPAALFMAVTKTLLKARAAEDRSPASILTYLNAELVKDNPSCMFVTVFLAILDVRGGRMVFTNAGHNFPYLREPDGTVHRLEERHGPVVGAVEGLVYRESTRVLRPGSTLLAYTDGVTEETGPDGEEFGTARLEQLLASGQERSAQQTVQSLVEAVAAFRADSAPRDDVTVLGVRLSESAGAMSPDALEVEIGNRLPEMDQVTEALERFATEHAVPGAVTRRLDVVLDEVLSNVISYAFPDEGSHRIQVRFELDGSRLAVTVSDDGIPFNPLQLPAPDVHASLEDRTPGGLGIHLVREMTDSVSYRRRIDRNVLRMEVDASRPPSSEQQGE